MLDNYSVWAMISMKERANRDEQLVLQDISSIPMKYFEIMDSMYISEDP
jgi:hypothetical protein